MFLCLRLFVNVEFRDTHVRASDGETFLFSTAEKLIISRENSTLLVFSDKRVIKVTPQQTPPRGTLINRNVLLSDRFGKKKKKKKQQVFFRAGVLGQMEEFRDERLSKIVSWMQAYMRGYLTRKDYKKLQEQRLALVVVQRNLRKYLQLRTWPWWKLWQKVKPLLNVTRIEDELAVSASTCAVNTPSLALSLSLSLSL